MKFFNKATFISFIGVFFLLLGLYFFLFDSKEIFSFFIDVHLFNLSKYFLFYICFFLLILFFYKVFIFKNTFNRKSKLKTKIILIFSLISILPSLLIAIFAVFFLNNGVQQWFEAKVYKTVFQATKVSQGYIHEQEMAIKDAMSKYVYDINEKNISVDKLEKYLNQKIIFSTFDDAIIFKAKPIIVIAKVNSLFSVFNLEKILADKLEYISREKIYTAVHNNTLIGVVKVELLPEDVYFAVTKKIDSAMLDYVDETEGALSSYQNLRNNLNELKLKFILFFIVIVFFIAIAVIIIAMLFANHITTPIQNLVYATTTMDYENLSTKVPIIKTKDEIEILSKTFNNMSSKLRLQKRQIVQAQKALVWSDVAKKVAHEINNPLTPIDLSAQMLLKKFGKHHENNALFEKYIKNILQCVHNIKNIVSSFFHFAKLPVPTFKKCDIISLLGGVLESRNIVRDDISYFFKSNVKSLNFSCDRNQIHQLITNLILNAEESLSSSNIKLKKISLLINYDGKKLIKIFLLDNGDGFSNEIIKKATNPYITTKSRGIGLGLAISKRIIEDHSGKIELCNNYSESNAKMLGAKVAIYFEQNDEKI